MLAVPLKRKFTTPSTHALTTTTPMTEETWLSKRSKMWDEETNNLNTNLNNTRNNKRSYPFEQQTHKKAKTTASTTAVFERRFDEKELKSVVERVIVWLSENASTLPSTPQDLHQTVRKFCNITTHIDPMVIFYHLLFNNVLIQSKTDNLNDSALDDENNDAVRNKKVIPNPAYNKNKPLLAFVLDGTSSEQQRGFSEEFGIALRQSISWATTTHPSFLPTTVDGYLRQLEVICCFRRSVPPSSVLSELERAGIVVYNVHDDLVTYSLPALPNSSLLYPHYMPQLSSLA